MNSDVAANTAHSPGCPQSSGNPKPTAKLALDMQTTESPRTQQVSSGTSFLRPFATGVTGGLLVLLSVVGCSEQRQGPPTAAVSGSVRLDGVPLAEGTIVFTPTQGTRGHRVSISITGGQFVVDQRHGPVVGTNKIQIHSCDGPAFDDEMTLASLHSSPRRISVVTVPPIYNTESQQVVEISSDDQNVLSFDLKTPSRR